MEALLRFFRKLSFFLRREEFANDLEEEMAFHRNEAAKQFEATGLSSDEANYAAKRQFGNTTRLKEESFDAVGFRFETALQDLRYAARQLRNNPGFATTAIVILALGIGATTAIFSAVNPILFEPLPYPHPRSVIMVWERRGDGSALIPNFADYVGLTERSRSFEALAAMKAWQPTMTGADQPERFEGQRVSAAYFRALGILPALGRDFQAADDQLHGPRVVILGDKLWRRRFNADTKIIGRTIKLDGDSFEVIAVMPSDLDNVLAPDAVLWAPLQYDRALRPNSREWGHHLRIVGRLRSGVTREQAGNELDAIARTLAQLYAKGYAEAGGPPAGFAVNSLQADVTRDVKPALLAVFGAVVLVLVIAGVNVTNLLLARAAQRRGEFAMRAALGASGLRIGRQLLTESLLLAAFGGVLGIFIAEFGVRALVALSPPGLPRLSAVRVDAAVFGFAFGIATLIGIAVGLIPALDASRRDPQTGLQQNSRSTTGGHQTARRTLVIAEVSLALVLLVSAGLLLRSLQHLFSIDPGFDSRNLLTMQVQEAGHNFDSDEARRRFFDQALERVRQLPGVVAAGFTSQLPLSGDQDIYGVEFANDSSKEAFFRYAVTPGYLEAMRIPLLRGRLIDQHDTSDAATYCFDPQHCGAAPAAVLISESFAKRKFGTQDPLGQRLRMGSATVPGHEGPWATIVGIVGDVKQSSLGVTNEDAIYIPSPQWFWADPAMSLVVRTRGGAAALAPAIKSAIWSVDKDQPIVRVATMDRLVAQSEAQRHFALIVFEAFALVALILAATGIYGVLSGSVTERMREIGVRAALGATRSNILGLIVRQGLTLTVVGVVIGLAGAIAASRALITLLFGISRIDPLTYFGVIALLLSVSVVACWLPAWRAARVDPSITLRAE